MQVERADLVLRPVDTARTEALEHVYARLFQQMRPRTPLPRIRIEFRRYANANARIRLHEGTLLVRMADTLADAPMGVLEALAEILLAKLFRKPVREASNAVYRRYLNRARAPEGAHYNLEELFEELNFRYFFGLMSRPALGWSPNESRTMLGHYDPSHNAIVLSRILDSPEVPRVAVEYVMFHEMLHMRYPVEHNGSRRRVHTREFKEAEKQFERLAEAKLALRLL
jgi:hypothetical protein